MSKINELIQTLCPDGVEYKKLGDVSSFANGKGHEKNIIDDGKYIVVNSKFVSTNGTVKKFSDAQICPLYIDDILMVMSDLPNGRALAKCYLVDENDKYTLNQRIGCFHTLNENVISTNFLFNVLNRNYQLLSYDNGIDQTNLRKDAILNIDIPVPPIPVQDEIVRILDEYTNLEAELEAKLSEEIELKQKQYEFYLEKLLTFSDTVEWKRLSDCCKNIGDGLHGTPVYDLISDYYFINGNNLKNKKIVIDEKTKRVNKESFMKYMLELDDNTLLMSINGTIGNLAMYHGENVILGKSVAYMSVIDTVLRRDFLYYFLQTTYTKQLLFQNVTGGTIKNLGLAVIRNFQIPVPSITEQERIVKILDKYNTYTRDMISVLNTELESRKKQYAYYRDQLLTFKRKE